MITHNMSAPTPRHYITGLRHFSRFSPRPIHRKTECRPLESTPQRFVRALLACAARSMRSLSAVRLPPPRALLAC